MTLPSSGTISFADIITEIQRSPGTTTSISDSAVRYLTREYSRLQASDAAASDNFGYSVAISSDGNTLAVGAHLDDNSGGTEAGSVYIFTRSGSTWAQQTRLQASDAAATDYFGYSVAISSDGNTLAVGSYLDDNSGGTNAGSVYVFTRSGSTWAQQTRIQASDAAATDLFGYSVAISSDGNTLAVGSYFDDNSGGTNAGSVYVFTRSGSTWAQQTRIQASDAAASDNFGISVAISSDGNTLAVGARQDDNSGGIDSGSVYVYQSKFVGPISLSDMYGGRWIAYHESLILKDASGGSSDAFGRSLAISRDGNTIAIGADSDNNSGGEDAGSVYIYVKSGSSFVLQTRLQGSDAAAYDYFGKAVSLSTDGNTLAVGANGDDNSRGTNAGSVYIFTRSGTTWTQQARLQASDGAANDDFGWSTCLSSDGNTLAVGAISDDNAGDASGSTYIFTRSGTTWTQRARLQPTTSAGSDQFGLSVYLSSDGNTLAASSPFDDGNKGSVTIFTRSGSTWTQQAIIQPATLAIGDIFGSSVSLSDDGNTLVVGAPSTSSNVGLVYVFTRSGTTWTQQATIQHSDNVGLARLGRSVSISSDGSTIAAGAPGKDPSGSGAVYVFKKSGSSWIELQKLTTFYNINFGLGSADFGLGGCVFVNSTGSSVLASATGPIFSPGHAFMFEYKNIFFN